MKPEEKLILDMDRALDVHRDKLSTWELGFLSDVRGILMSKYANPTPKQKNMCRGIIKKVSNSSS